MPTPNSREEDRKRLRGAMTTSAMIAKLWAETHPTYLDGHTATGRYVHARHPDAERSLCGIPVMTTASVFDPDSVTSCPRCKNATTR